jgi:ZIP family zinc transporter
MLEAILIGGLAQSALILSGLLVYGFKFPDRFIGLLAGFGVGALIEAVAFDLVSEASNLSKLQFGAWMLLGAAVFLVSDRVVEKRFGGESEVGSGSGSDSGGGSGQAMGIVVGSIVDGVPESAIFGIQVATNFPLSISFLLAVFISNFPQALAPSADLRKSGWKMGKLVGMWTLVVLACAAAAGIGYALAHTFSGVNGDRMAALAGGGLLAMIADSMMPFAVERGGKLVAVSVVLGFCLPLMAAG